MPSRRTIGRCSVPAQRTIGAVRPASVTATPSAQQPWARARHVEAPVEPVRATDATRRQAVGSAARRALWLGLARLTRQSTMSTSTWLPSPAAAAFTTVRNAWAVRPPRPITLP